MITKKEFKRKDEELSKMVNALSYDSGSGVVPSTSKDVLGDTTYLSAENFDVIDLLDDGIVLAVSRTNGCDINADTTIHTPLSTQDKRI